MGTSKKRIAESRQVSVSKYAIQNIEDIVNYIAFVKQQPVNAVNVSKAIEATIAKIALHPLAYKECGQLLTKTKKYRQAICLSWLIIYKVTNAKIIILSVIHGARSPKEISKLKKLK